VKSILVPLSGSGTDTVVMEAAYALALRLGAHLDFAHIPLAGVDLRLVQPHIDFARGESLQAALKDLAARSRAGEARTFSSVEEFCKSKGIVQLGRPVPSDGVSAGWVGKPCEDVAALLQCARAHELIVVGRSTFGNTLSLNLLDALVTECGRPLLLVPPAMLSFSFDTIAVWWKDHSAAARAMSAAMPVIATAKRVCVLTIPERGQSYGETAAMLAEQLGWHGVEASHRVLHENGTPAIDTLWAASVAEKAGLVVMGAYSRSRMRELIFGGCTQAALETGVLPVLLQH
jgi:nucleotide-binding universal stress UspA family protein